MRVLIYSDIHANWEALQAVNEAAAGRYDMSVCLGDVVGYGANPNEAVAWVRATTPDVIRGNHDRACAGLHGLEWFNQSAATAARWTHARLEAGATDWLNSLPAGPVRWHELSLVHGSPLNEDEYLIDPAQAAGVFAATTETSHWFGHTHVQGGFALADDQVVMLGGARPEAEAEAGHTVLQLQPGARYLLNPGSVGQPRDGDWRAAFALLDEQSGQVEFHRVPYDLSAAQARIIEAGLPPQLARRLAKGK
jgi:diadenosine tetraphosphatase ApaH/serine/threonine PP2A family protein phosphatase